MYGNAYGDGPIGDEQQPYRAIVQATATVAAQSVSGSDGGATAQGQTSVAAVGAIAARSVGFTQSSTFTAQQAIVAPRDAAVGAAEVSIAQNATIAPAAAMIVEATATFTQAADVAPKVVGVSTAKATVQQRVDASPDGGSLSFGRARIAQKAEIAVSSGMSENPEFVLAEEPVMMPLIQSHDANQIELELKEALINIFEARLRASERYVNALGMPHTGTTDLVSQSLAAQGLSIFRGARDVRGVGAYLLRAWVAHNPKRGLKLLQTYLQLMWPNVWKATQMWQDKDLPYPEGLSETDEGNHYLTSRVNVTLPGRVTDGSDLNAIQMGLRASVPARIVMNIAVTDEAAFPTGVTTAYYQGAVACHYEGTFK